MNSGVRISQLIAPVFWPVHRDILARGHKEYWLMGGRGSTKSSFIATEIILGIIRQPEANAIVYRKVAETLRGSVYEELLKVIDRMGLGRFFKARLAPLEIDYIPTGQRILFRGADKPEKSKSTALRRGYFGFLWFEELAEFMGMDDVRTIQASVIRGKGDAITLYSYNPPMSAGVWVNKEALVPSDGRMVHKSCYLDVPKDWLGEAFIANAEALKQSNELAYRHMYLGEVTGTGGQVFGNLQLRTISDAELDGFGHFYNGLDFGFAVDPDAFGRWAYDPKHRVLMAVGEYYAAGNTIDRLAEAVKRLANREVVRCDSADPRMINELRLRGVNAIGVKKGPGSIEHGMRWMQNLGSIVIDPKRTPNIAREFSAYEYARDRAGNFLPEYPDADNHEIDAARYGMEPEIGKQKLKTMDKRSLGL